ncbi:MAG: KamA family radical SAM protein [Simkania negevensis]|nr:KamA family radical SAM protein [Simkania negevensis]
MSKPMWQAVLKNNFRNWRHLADFLELDQEKRGFILTNPSFTLNLPERLAKKIKKNDLTDPILLQFLPQKKELKKEEGYVADPTCDFSFNKGGRLLHKYKGRVLLVTTSGCAMHCRFCFRQNYPYEKKEEEFAEEMSYIEQHPDIEEVILSGGDPLILSDYKLKQLVERLERISHVKILRFHTRFITGIPERITISLLELLKSSRFQIVCALHINHRKELDEEVLYVMKQLRQVGVLLLSHTVLLKGINDNLKTLKELFFSLASQGILPYYLNQLDQVEGSGHYKVAIKKGKELIKALREELPGYAIPRYAKEVPYEKNKTLIY